LQDYPGKYFIRRDLSTSFYVDDTHSYWDLYVIAPCEATAAPEVSDEDHYRPVVLMRPYAYKRRLFKAAVVGLSSPMRCAFFSIGASCHQGGIHKAIDMAGKNSYLPGTLKALERRRLIVYHGGQYSNQLIEMTAFGKDLWRAIFSNLLFSRDVSAVVDAAFRFR
jgi:hypothetical protein